MNQLSTAKRAQIVAALVEGNSIRATCRATGAAKNTVVKLLRDLGAACEDYQDRSMRNLPCRRIEWDGIRAFVHCNKKALSIEKITEPVVGDLWTWSAVCADTKLVPTWLLGGRDVGSAELLVCDLVGRLAIREQLTTDGQEPYLDALDNSVSGGVDYAMLVKLHGAEANDRKTEPKYSRGKSNGAGRDRIKGRPPIENVSRSRAERQNLTMRMSMRGFTWLTKAFSKKVENLTCAVAFHFMSYNYCQKHETINETPAQAAGLTDHRWSIEEVLALLD